MRRTNTTDPAIAADAKGVGDRAAVVAALAAVGQLALEIDALARAAVDRACDLMFGAGSQQSASAAAAPLNGRLLNRASAPAHGHQRRASRAGLHRSSASWRHGAVLTVVVARMK